MTFTYVLELLDKLSSIRHHRNHSLLMATSVATFFLVALACARFICPVMSKSNSCGTMVLILVYYKSLSIFVVTIVASVGVPTAITSVPSAGVPTTITIVVLHTRTKDQ